jgi:deferrochelatase/peroxidase EfeB
MALTRRALIGAGAAGGLAAAGVAGYEIGASSSPGDGSGADAVAFHGRHQAGIATPAQDRLHFAAFDVVAPGREDVRDLLRAWTAAAARMTAGRPAEPAAANALLPPADTGEALGLGPARLTVTVGLGPSLFDDRFGLARARPPALRDLPPLPGDELAPERSGGDLCVQACADDPQVAFHAVRNLARIGRGVVVMRWSQLGFGRTSTTSRAQATPRNLMGFKDGTNNLRAEDVAALDRHVWVGSEGPGWMRDGSYLVTRRIRMLIEAWDRASLADQEQTIGRTKTVGAPMGARHEHDRVDLRSRAIPADAHIRLASPGSNGGVRILRRGYSFTDGFDDELGQLDAGLFFIAYQRDPHRQFVELQRRLGAGDALNEYIKHTASAVFAVPPGVRGQDDWLGRRLFGAYAND